MAQRSEFRKHYYLDDIVLIAPKRADKPNSYKQKHKLSELNTVTCPFCNNTERIKYAISNESGWSIKVIDNIFPAVTVNNPYAYGVQEVIIESPDHNELFCEMSVPRIETILKVYQNRIIKLKDKEHIKFVNVWKNNGPRAAASIHHSHSQIYGLPLVPELIKKEQKAFKEYKIKNNSCAICDANKTELNSKVRIIGETDSILVIAPYASKSPYEAWIIPKKHTAHFENVNSSVLYDMAEYLKVVSEYLNENNIDFNLLVNSLANSGGHCYLQILPRPNIWGGFELSTDIIINPVSPELAANNYRLFLKDKIKQPLYSATAK
jgi:UDPglucose--hexose-1-phosphate uridylyltransferase